MYHLKNFKKNGNKAVLFVLCLIFVVVISQIALIVKDNANALSGSDRAVQSTKYEDSDPYYGTKDYWNEKYGDHEDKYLDNITPGQDLTGTWFVNKSITIKPGETTLAGFSVSGELNLYFEDNGSIEINIPQIKNEDGYTGGSPAGIRLLKGNTLNVAGKGSLIITSGGIDVDVNNLIGKNAVAGYFNKPNLYFGLNGAGGNGSGGCGALIGSDGGAGGTGGTRVEYEHIKEAWDSKLGIWRSPAYVGYDGENGKDGLRSADSGNLTISGLVSLSLNPGGITKINTIEAGSPSDKLQYKVEDGVFWNTYHFLGGNAGGAAGNLGFLGSIFGSGGSGGAGGGAGGEAGGDYSAWGSTLFANGGGAGAGMGSTNADGSKTISTDKKSYLRGAANGGNFVAGNNNPGKGGSGAGGGNKADGAGGAGGNGGKSPSSGNAGACYIVPGMIPSNEPNESSDYEGKESERYLVYPQEDCKIVMTQKSLSDLQYVYPWKGEPVTPEFKVIYIPTGEEISTDCYDVEWIDNGKTGNAKLIVKGRESFSTTTATIGKSMTEPGGKLEQGFIIGTQFIPDANEDQLCFKTKNYDSNPEEIHFEGTIGPDWIQMLNPETHESLDIPFRKEDCRFIFWKLNTETDVYEKLDKAPKDVGKYKVDFEVVKSYITYYNVRQYEFQITPAIISIDDSTEYYSVTKVYDGTYDVLGSKISGCPIFNGFQGDEQEKLTITFNIKEFPSIDVCEKKQTRDVIYKNPDDEDILKNYSIPDESKHTEVLYTINPRVLTVKDVKPTNRWYEEGIYDIEADATFENLLPEEFPFIKDRHWEAAGKITDEECLPGIHNCNVIIKLLSENFLFADGSRVYETPATVEILSNKVTKPTPSSTVFKYTGKELTYDVPGVKDAYDVKGNTGTKPGNYTATYSLIDKETTTWNDGTKEDIDISWKINKADSRTMEEQTATVSWHYKDDITYTLDLSDVPVDMKINQMWVHDYKTTIFDKCEIVSKKYLIFRIKEWPFPLIGNITIKVSSDYYEDSNLPVVINLCELAAAKINGFSVEKDKRYDGKPSPLNDENLEVLITDKGFEGSDITSQVKSYVTYQYYKKVNDEEYIEIPSDPCDAGDYKCIAQITPDKNLYVAAESDPVYFTISKADAIEFPVTYEDHCIGIHDSHITSQLNIDKIPEGQNYTIEYEKMDDALGIIKDGKVEVKDNTEEFEYDLDKTMVQVNAVATITFKIQMENYDDTEIQYQLKIVPKHELTLGGISVIDKEYDGELLSYNGDFFIKDGDKDITKELECGKDYDIIYYDKAAQRTVEGYATDAGTYTIKIMILEQQEYYFGEVAYDATITRKMLDLKEEIEPLNITKTFDGTADKPEMETSIDVKGIVEKDKDLVSASFIPQDFSTANVHEVESWTDTQLTGEMAKNYDMKNGKLFSIYSITPKEITTNCDNIAAVDRPYDPDNHDIEIDGISFDGIIDGFPVSYEAHATLEDNNVSESIQIDSFNVKLLPEERLLNITNFSDTDGVLNYKFEDGEETTIELENPIYANISKADVPYGDTIQESVTYQHDFGQKTYKLSDGLYPKGMLKEGTKFYTKNKEDANNMISDWRINEDTGEITFNLNNIDNASANAKLNFVVESKNYNNATASLNVSLNNTDEGTQTSETSDYTFMIVALLAIVLLGSGATVAFKMRNIYK